MATKIKKWRAPLKVSDVDKMKVEVEDVLKWQKPKIKKGGN